jgi:hypothetical protein
VYFFSVFAKAFQQRNVNFMNYGLAIPTSYVLSTCDMAVFSLVAWNAVQADSLIALALRMGLMVFAVGTGGALGSVTAMYIHHRYFTKERFK